MASPQETSATSLFLRFREEGDAMALTGVFDKTAPELLALAAHLSPSLTDAEDLVQHTFLVAIQKARKFDENRTILPWLAGILIKEAKTQRRKRGRKIDPERLAQRSQADASRGALYGELRTTVERTLERLPPKYGDVLRAHLLEGANAQEIAASTGIATGTVRVQLHRGYDLLRRALPSGLCLGVLGCWMPNGMAAMRQTVHAQALAHAPAFAGAAGGASLSYSVGILPASLATLSSIAMQTKWIAATALLLVTGIGALWWPRAESPGPSSLESQDTQGAQLVQAKGPLEPQAPSNLRATATLEPTREHQGAAPEQGRADTEPSPEDLPAPEHAILRLALTGKVAPQPTTFRVRVSIGTENAHTLERETHSLGDLEIPLTEGARSTPLDELRVLVQVQANGYLPASAWADLEPRLVAQAEAGPGGSPSTVAIYRATLQPRLIERILTGRLLDADGQPAQDGWVAFRPDSLGEHFWTRSPASRSCDPDGSFAVALTHHDAGVLIGQAPGHRVHSLSIPLTQEVKIDLGDVQLERGAIIRGRAERDGTPLPEGSIVRATLPRKPVPQDYHMQKVQPEGEGAEHFEVETTVGPGGAFELTGLVEGRTYWITADAKGDFTSYLHHGEGGQPIPAPAYDVVIDWGKVPVQLEITSQGEAVQGAQVRSIRPAEGAWWGYPIHLRGGWQNPARSGRDGRANVHLPLNTTVHLEITARGYQPAHIAVDSAQLPPSRVVSIDLEAGAQESKLIVQVTGVESGTLARAHAFFYTFDNEQGLKQLDPVRFQDNVAHVQGLRPGTDSIHLHLYFQGHKSYADLPFIEQKARHVTFAPLQEGETRTIETHLERGGRIELTVSGMSPGAPSPGFAVVGESGQRFQPTPLQRGPAGETLEAPWTQDGPGLLGPWLAPGTYRITPTHADYANDEITVQVKAGQVTQALFALRPAP